MIWQYKEIVFKDIFFRCINEKNFKNLIINNIKKYSVNSIVTMNIKF